MEIKSLICHSRHLSVGRIRIQESSENVLNGRVVIFNENLGRIAEQYLRRDRPVISRGNCKLKWTDQQGVEKYSTEVVLQRFRGDLTLLGGRADTSSGMMDSGGFGGGGGRRSTPTTGGRASPPPMRNANDIDDDIPF